MLFKMIFGITCVYLASSHLTHGMFPSELLRIIPIFSKSKCDPETQALLRQEYAAQSRPASFNIFNRLIAMKTLCQQLSRLRYDANTGALLYQQQAGLENLPENSAQFISVQVLVRVNNAQNSSGFRRINARKCLLTHNLNSKEIFIAAPSGDNAEATASIVLLLCNHKEECETEYHVPVQSVLQTPLPRPGPTPPSNRRERIPDGMQEVPEYSDD